jgi:glycosyltransferase involved in cell wall biosynthesis
VDAGDEHARTLPRVRVAIPAVETLMPRVSVLVPAYNVASFVGEALTSVAQQTFTDWEIVAVDDASSDDTHQLLLAAAALDPRIRVFRNPRNLGMTANWNRALAESRGDFILKLDADDALKPRALELLVEAMREGVIAAAVRTLCCDPNLEPVDGLPGDDAVMRAGLDPYADHDLDTKQWFVIAAHGQQLWHSNAVMWPRTTLDAIGRYDEHFGCASDTELIWRTLEQPGIFAHRGYVGVLYRIRPGSVSDEYRSRGWLTWEGTAANILTIDRYRRRFELPRSLRVRYAYLWHRWQSHATQNARELPPDVWSKLSDVAQATPPSAVDTMMWRMRDALRL